ncbi:nucleoside triphosphate pyrophosphohydrolase family protein [Sinorhizobium fredii]|uniref:hypothetical protein n=1 Tax=Rhizobium fredii TaxID=380 RepID=UPI001FCAABF6|nr:hypothetical protein [Sinorhizobium fredii]WOS65974.1 hypothetical protein SFGR64A_19750 [Sinorhizobium fredii GR64]
MRLLTTDVLALELKRCEEGRVCPAFFVAYRSAADGGQHLLINGQARPSANGSGGTREALEDEAADLFGQFVFYLRENNIAIEAAIEREWLRHLDRYIELDDVS